MSTSDPQNQNPAGPIRPPQIPDHELLRCIGRGSYGAVWLARNIMGTWRAVKVVYRSSFEDDRPFEREFNGIQKFEPISRSHDSQVDILHVGRNADYFYYVMELADDQQLGQQINPDTYQAKTLKSEALSRGVLPVDECVSLGLQLTTALAHLHGEGLVHRDIKPSNIIFINGVPKLGDIGLVTSTDATRSFVGTQGFYPPEGPGTPQADIYSLGKVLYELFTDRDRQDFPDLPTSLAEHPERERLLELNSIVAKACAPEPKHRYKSAEAMRQDLLVIQSGESVRRMRSLEQRIARLTRAGVVLGVVVALAMAAYFFQRHETRQVKTIADQKTALAGQSQRQLIQHEISTGNRLVEQGEHHTALLWFAEALKRMTPGSKEESVHRVRIQSVLDRAPRLLHVLTGQEKSSHSDAQFSPDGRFFVSRAKDPDNMVRLWDTETGQLTSPLFTHADWLGASVFSRDGKKLVTSGWPEGTIVWDLVTTKPVFSMKWEEHEAVYASMSPDGRRLLIRGRGNRFMRNGLAVARLWDIESNTQIGPDMEHGYKLQNPVFSPDSELVLTVSADRENDGGFDRSVCIWKTGTGELVARFKHDEGILEAAFSPDGKRVATRQNGISIWNVTDRRRLDCKMPEAVGSRVYCPMSFTPDGTRIVAAINNRTVQIWDAETGLPVSSPLKHGGQVWKTSFSPDGRRILTACEDGKVRLWDMERGEQVTAPMSHAVEMATAIFHPDGRRILTADRDGMVKVWDTSEVFERKVFIQLGVEISGFPCFSPNGKEIAYCKGDGPGNEPLHSGVTILEIETGNETVLHQETIFQPSAPVQMQWKLGADVSGKGEVLRGYHAVSFSPDGHFVLASGSGYMSRMAIPRLWDTSTKREITTFGGEIKSSEACFSPSGTMIAVASLKGEVQVWDTQGQALTRPLPCGDPFVTVNFSPDSRWLLTGSYDGTVRVWDIATQKLLLGPLQHSESVEAVQFTPDGKHILVRQNRFETCLWSVTGGNQPIATFRSMWNPISFNTSRRWMLTQPTKTTIAMLDYVTGEKIRTDLREYWLSHAEFSRDGLFYATASYDGGRSRVWETENGQPVTPPLEHSQTTWFAGFSPDSSKLLTVGLNRYYPSTAGKSTFTLWNLPPCKLEVGEIVDLAQALSGSSLEPNDSYLPLPPDVLRSKHLALRAKHPKLFSRATEFGGMAR